MKRASVLLAGGIILLLGLSRLDFDTDVLNLLPEELPEVHGLKEYQRHFAQNNEVVISVVSDSAEASGQAAEEIAGALSGRTNLVKHAAWQLPWLGDSTGAAEFIAWLWLSKPPEEAEALRNRLTGDEARRVLEDAVSRLGTSLSPVELARLGHDPFGLSEIGGAASFSRNEPDWFASRDGKMRLVFVQPATLPLGFEGWTAWLREVRAEVDRVAAGSGWESAVRTGYTGTPVFTVETAESMEGDMKQSVASTMVLIGLLFWWAHRRLWPLGWMLIFLGGSLAFTMAAGGFIFGSLNVVSLGFAAILLGLGVDYALVSYQELLEHPRSTAGEIRKLAGPGIGWSAGTTALAFLLLNFAGLPGLGQLGTLVAIGIVTAAAAMLFGFLPAMTWKPPAVRRGSVRKAWHFDGYAWPLTGGLILVSGVVLLFFWPDIDRTSDALGSANSPAGRAAREIDERLSGGAETLWLVTEGATVNEVGDRLRELRSELESARPALQFELPVEVWPNPENQNQNVGMLAGLENELPRLEQAAAEAGFTPEALDLTRAVLGAWRRFEQRPLPVWPSSSSSQWLVDRVAAKTPEGWAALGMLRLDRQQAVPDIATPGVLVAGWSRLAEALLNQVQGRLQWLTIVVALALAVCLRLALRSWKGVLLSFATLAFGMMLTMVVMALFGWKWNLMSLTAIPLLLGASVDYTIHVQLALRRHNGNAPEMRRTIGRALLLVTAGAVAGFGSLAFATHAGLASFELVCAAGMICIFFVAVYLLPAWRAAVTKGS